MNGDLWRAIVMISILCSIVTCMCLIDINSQRQCKYNLGHRNRRLSLNNDGMIPIKMRMESNKNRFYNDMLVRFPSYWLCMAIHSVTQPFPTHSLEFNSYYDWYSVDILCQTTNNQYKRNGAGGTLVELKRHNQAAQGIIGYFP